MEAEKLELEEAIATSELNRHDMATELSAVQERLETLEGETKNMAEEREQIEQQKSLIAEKLGADDLGKGGWIFFVTMFWNRNARSMTM